VKDAVQDVVQDVAKDVAEDVTEDASGAAEDGSLKVLILPSPSFSGGTHAQHTHNAPRACP